MSATVEQPPTRPAVACPRCGAEVPPERDWCLECGEAARTQILPARGWKLPIAIVVGVVLLAGVAAVVTFVQLSSDAGDAARLAQAPTTAPPAPTAPPPAATTTLPPGATPTAPTPPTVPPTPATPAPTGTVGTWPAGRTAYTVVLISSTSPTAARAAAQKLLGKSRGEPVGTLRSDDHPGLTPGYVVVFSGQYDTLVAAQRAAQGWHGMGSRGAYAKLVRAGGVNSGSGAPPPVAPTGAAPAPSGGGAAPATP